MKTTKVIGGYNDTNIIHTIQYNTNKILSTYVYNVLLHNEYIKQYSANLIADNLYSKVEKWGYIYTMIYGIVDHLKITFTI